MSEWGSNRSYQTKISRLTGSGNGKLNSSTLLDDTGFDDELIGGSGVEWFWVGIDDFLQERESFGRIIAI